MQGYSKRDWFKNLTGSQQFDTVRASTRRRGQRAAIPKEIHFLEGSTAHNCNTAGHLTHISDIDQGPAVDERLGRTCKLVRLEMRCRFMGGATQVVTLGGRIALVLDHEPRGAAAAITDIFNTSMGIMKMASQSFTHRFEVLVDKSVMLKDDWNAFTAGALSPCGHFLTFDMPLNIVVEYSSADTTGAIANVIHNALYVCVGGDAGTDDTTAISCDVEWRLWFVDL